MLSKCFTVKATFFLRTTEDITDIAKLIVNYDNLLKRTSRKQRRNCSKVNVDGDTWVRSSSRQRPPWLCMVYRGL